MAVIAVVGATNLDIQGFPFAGLAPEDSNPGRIKISHGGVGRNIAENAARLGASVDLITVFGGDQFALEMRERLRSLGVDTTGSLTLPEKSSSVYMCVLEVSGKLHVAIADMASIESIDSAWIEAQSERIHSAQLCVVDANLPQPIIERLSYFGMGTRLFLDPVSEAKAGRAAACVGSFYAIKPNRREAEILSGRPIAADEGLAEAADEFHRRGTQLVFISLGERGMFFSAGNGRSGDAGARPDRGIALAPDRPVRNVSGAGDAASAAIAEGVVRGMSIRMIAKSAIAAAALTVGVDETVNPRMNAAAVAELAQQIRVMEVR
ncbi:MAG TPA: PfkB family carbohydrate kinase [Spirochaetia bacterium]|nr:PfkB family carbohydrate kinase [Spirochaetia bacterium]